MEKKKLGIMIEGPNPRCTVCIKSYVHKEMNLIGTKWFYVCGNCGSMYEIADDQDKPKLALKKLLEKERERR